MAKIIDIINRVGTGNLINGAYDVTANVAGYDNATINPANITVERGVNTYNFSIAASGALTLHVTEDGTSSGTAVVGASFVRTDASGNEYGDAVVSDSTGNAVLANVPYASTDAPTIYYKQVSSDGNHEFDSSVQSITLNEQAETVEVINSLGEERTINLTDANYANLLVPSGSITFKNQI